MFDKIFGKIVLTLSPVLVLSGCAETYLATHAFKSMTYEEAGYSAPAITEKRKIGNPYTILGKTYYPDSTSENYRRKGIASWYGKDFHGKKTANGEDYNMYTMTAAHPTLPLPTYVRVTNLENGRAVIVRVNDRGPFLRGRIIDLSYAAATQLDMANQGTAPVLLEALPTDGSMLRVAHNIQQSSPSKNNMPDTRIIAAEPGGIQEVPSKWTTHYASEERAKTFVNPNEKPLSPPENMAGIEQPEEPNIKASEPVEVGAPVEIYVQTGAFGDIRNALKQREQLMQTYNNVVVQETLKNGRSLHRVRIGPLEGVADADTLLNQLISAGWQNANIVIE